MPNTLRGNIIQTLDGAIGNLEWALDKVAKVGVTNVEGNKYYEDNNIPLPELNQTILEGLALADENISNAIKVLEGLKQIV